MKPKCSQYGAEFADYSHKNKAETPSGVLPLIGN